MQGHNVKIKASSVSVCVCLSVSACYITLDLSHLPVCKWFGPVCHQCKKKKTKTNHNRKAKVCVCVAWEMVRSSSRD